MPKYRVILAVLLILFVIGMASLGWNSNPMNTSSVNNSGERDTHRPACSLLKYGHYRGEPIGVFNGTAVYRLSDGFSIGVENSTYLINASRVFFFDWGFVAFRNESEVNTVPLVKFIVGQYGKTNVSTGNVTAEVPVVVLKACTHDGNPLWNLTLSGYAWAYDGGRYGVKSNGTALPTLLVANTSDYLYVLVYQTTPRSYSEFRNYVHINDYFYVLGKNGTVRKFDLGRGFVPIRNTFLISNGSYVLMGFERPQPDGSPMSGYVMILNGTEVVWSRLFQMNDPSCLCYVIPGWGRINENGCAVFGLYDGEGRYCDGKFIYVANTTG
ncbi:hypothetical protein [Thermococcus prieurii]